MEDKELYESLTETVASHLYAFNTGKNGRELKTLSGNIRMPKMYILYRDNVHFRGQVDSLTHSIVDIFKKYKES